MSPKTWDSVVKLEVTQQQVLELLPLLVIMHIEFESQRVGDHCIAVAPVHALVALFFVFVDFVEVGVLELLVFVVEDVNIHVGSMTRASLLLHLFLLCFFHFLFDLFVGRFLDLFVIGIFLFWLFFGWFSVPNIVT